MKFIILFFSIHCETVVQVTYLWAGVIIYWLVDEQADLFGPISRAVSRYWCNVNVISYYYMFELKAQQCKVYFTFFPRGYIHQYFCVKLPSSRKCGECSLDAGARHAMISLQSHWSALQRAMLEEFPSAIFHLLCRN